MGGKPDFIEKLDENGPWSSLRWGEYKYHQTFETNIYNII